MKNECRCGLLTKNMEKKYYEILFITTFIVGIISVIMPWGQRTTIPIQMFLGNGSPKNLAGEWIVFMCLAIYLSAACMKNGIWDRKLKPNFKTNVIASVIAGTALGVIWFVISYQNYHNFIGSIMTGVFMFVCTGGLCLAALVVSSLIYKKRVEKLEKVDEDSMCDE